MVLFVRRKLAPCSRKNRASAASDGFLVKSWWSAISTIELSLKRSSNAKRRKRAPTSAETLTDNFTAVEGKAEFPAIKTPRGLPFIVERFVRITKKGPSSYLVGLLLNIYLATCLVLRKNLFGITRELLRGVPRLRRANARRSLCRQHSLQRVHAARAR